MPMHSDIAKFFLKNHVAALSVEDEEGTWSCCCFYVFVPSDPTLLFLSYMDTHHSRLMTRNPAVSGTVSQQTKSVLRIQGAQFKGVAYIADSTSMRQLYNSRFPFANTSDAALWAVRINYVKFTSNILKFGEKVHWERTK